MLLNLELALVIGHSSEKIGYCSDDESRDGVEFILEKERKVIVVRYLLLHEREVVIVFGVEDFEEFNGLFV